jgi:hypothetical protein
MKIKKVIQSAKSYVIDAFAELSASPWLYRDDEGHFLASVFIGSVSNIFPSGKYYLPFACGNVNPCPQCKGTGKSKTGKDCPYCQGSGSREIYEDEIFNNTLENTANESGCFIQSGEGDPCDVHLVCVIADSKGNSLHEKLFALHGKKAFEGDDRFPARDISDDEGDEGYTVPDGEQLNLFKE